MLNYPMDWSQITSAVSDFFQVGGIALIVVSMVAVGLVSYVLIQIRHMGERIAK